MLHIRKIVDFDVDSRKKSDSNFVFKINSTFGILRLSGLHCDLPDASIDISVWF